MSDRHAIIAVSAAPERRITVVAEFESYDAALAAYETVDEPVGGWTGVRSSDDPIVVANRPRPQVRGSERPFETPVPGAPIRWRRDGRGRQVSACGRYAVEVDGYERSQSVGASSDFNYRTGEGQYEGFIGGEWGAIVVADDENIDWFATAREAKAACQAHADRAAR